MNHDVFISYSKNDAKQIETLCKALTAAQIKYWIDKKIDGSENFLAEIPIAIQNCSIVLFVASKDSAISEWTQKELLYARKCKKEIFPYKLNDFKFENCPELDFFFTNIQWKDSVEEVVAGLSKKLGQICQIEYIESNLVKAIVYVSTDLDCRVFKFDEEICIVRVGQYVKIELPLGVNILRFVGLECGDDCYEEELIIEDVSQKTFKIKLLNQYKTRKAEQERIDAEKRAIAKAEKEAYLLDLPDEEFIVYTQKKKSGFKIKSSQEVVVPLKYDYVKKFEEGLAEVRLNGKAGFIDKIGREIVCLKYDGVYHFKEGLAAVGLDNKCGFIDKVGREVIPLMYDDAVSFSEGLACVGLNGKYGFINKAGRVIVPLMYDYAKGFSEGLAAVKLNGKYGFINKKGAEIIPFIYDMVSLFYEGEAFVILNGENFIIDKKGNRIE